MSLRGWETLACECGNDHFQAAHRITWHEQHGTAVKQDGWTCTGCGKRSDTGKMINVAKQRVLQSRIAELEQQKHV